MYNRAQIMNQLLRRIGELEERAEVLDQQQVDEFTQRYGDVGVLVEAAAGEWAALLKVKRSSNWRQIADAATAYSRAAYRIHSANVPISEKNRAGSSCRLRVAAIENVLAILGASNDVEISGAQLNAMGALALLKRQF